MKRLANRVKGWHPHAYREAEIELMKSMLAAKATVKEVSTAIKRSTNSIYVYCHKYGISIKHLRGSSMTVEAIKRRERRIRAEERRNAANAKHP